MSRLADIACLAVMALALLFTGCHKEDMGGSDGQKPDASLTVRLNVPSVEAEVKSVSDYPSDPERWTRWERAVDGRYLYRVTAFLLQGNRLVAVKDLEFDSGEPDRAEMSFDGNFVHGTYRLMVVANYSAHTADDGTEGVKTYAGLAGFTDTVRALLNSSGVVDDFTGTYDASFLKFMISSQNGICPRVPQPLSLVKDIELHPGVNTIDGELLRTYSRIRIAVENQSDEQLEITSLTFNNTFTQTAAYLFPNIGYYSGKTAINTADDNAITPFTADAGSPLLIPARSAATVFDAYILESRKGSGESGYKYLLGLGYGGTETYILTSTTQINAPGDLSSGYYLIYNARRARYLKAGTSYVESANLGQLQAGDELSKEYVWALDNSGLSANRFYIGTPEILQDGDQSAYYMAQTSEGVQLSSLFSNSYYFTFSAYSYNNFNYLAIKSSSDSYLQVNSRGSVSGTGSTGTSTRFYLYPVTRTGAAVHEIALKTIDETTGQPADVEEIKRNDFINALVAVSYNKNTGHFTFEVKDWGTAGGDVSFN